MDIFGSFALLLAFLATVYAFVAGIVGIVTRRTLLTKSARNAGMAVFGLVTLAVASLEYFFFTDNFSLAYVAAHSNHALPLYYKFSALWAGKRVPQRTAKHAARRIKLLKRKLDSRDTSESS